MGGKDEPKGFFFFFFFLFFLGCKEENEDGGYGFVGCEEKRGG